MRAAKEYRYPLRLPAQDEPAINDLAKKSGHSINSVLVLCIRKGLPLVQRALFQDAGRVTAVDPLPEPVLERIYSEPDELEGVTAEQLSSFQSHTEPE
jgi:hypothetical protein